MLGASAKREPPHTNDAKHFLMPRSHGWRTPRLPRYAVVRPLGAGGSGAVYLVRDLLNDSREVALKSCHGQIPPQQLLREFRILRELRHPGIARAFEFGRLPSSGDSYFTLEYVPGPDLERESATLRRMGQEERVAPLLDLFLQVTDALAYLHRKGLLHLDLKPANVVVSGGRAKLIDFGLFQSMEIKGRRHARGTPYFAAPEALEEGPIDRRADLYSLGATFYRSFTGSYPVEGRTYHELVEHHRRRPPREPRGMPAGLARIVMKLLSKAREHRYQSAEEVSQALRELLPAARSESMGPSYGGLELTGRKREMASFFDWYEGLRRGTAPRVLLVEGEPGIGKTRFAEACVTEMLSLESRVISIESSGRLARDGMRQIVEKVSALQPLSTAERSRYRFLLTSTGIRIDRSSLAEIRSLALDQIRARAFQEAMDLIARRAEPALVFVIEDCHRADEQLRDFLRRLSAEWSPDPGQATRIGVLATCRTGRLPADLVGLARGAGARDLVLKPLGRDDILRSLRDLQLPGGVKEHSRLAVLSHGNPGLLALHLRRLGKPWDEAHVPAGAGVADLLRSRLRGLGPRERSIALMLALLGRPAHERLLRDLCGAPEREFARAIVTLEDAEVVRGNRTGYFLEQDLIEDARKACSARSLPAAHERIGLRLLRERGELGEAADHLLQAGHHEKGVQAAERAGRELLDAGRVDAAAQVYSRAVDHAADALTRIRILEALGDAEERRGKFDEAERCFRRILAEAHLPAVLRLRSLRKQAGISQRRGDDDAASASFESALSLLDHVDQIEEHLLLFNELAAFHLFRGDLARSATFANRSLELLTSPAAGGLTRDAHAYHSLNAHSASGHILLRQFEYRRAAREFLRGLKQAERIGSLSNVARILNNLGIAYNQSNRLREALSVYGRATSLARRLGDATALFSIRCNLACIRARLGEMRAAEEILGQAQEMTQPRQSKRARLFLVYTRALIQRLWLLDAREEWEESIRLADELPDPILASYGRIYLADNEIHEGRWGSARRVLAGLGAFRDRDVRLERSIAVRQAYLAALCGHSGDARASLPPRHAEEESDYAALWEHILSAAALIEIGELRAADDLLERTRAAFDSSGQPTGALQCSLLLIESSLRAGNGARASKALEEANRSMGLHDTDAGSRRAAAWMPFLAARAALQEGRSPAGAVASLLERSSRSLEQGSSSELRWLIELVALENGEPGAERRLRAARASFLRGLEPADRKAYLARDHRQRLGLTLPGSQPTARTTAEAHKLHRYDALLRLRQLKEPQAMLSVALEATGAERGAIFLDGESGVAAVHGFNPRGRKTLDGLRSHALRAGSGAVGRGLCAEVKQAGGRRIGVLYVESPGALDDRDLAAFLEAYAQGMGQCLAAGQEAPRKLSDLSPTLVRTMTMTRTRTLTSTTFIMGESSQMRDLATLVQRTRDSRLPILITAESGAGKDHLARWIHSLGTRREGPFVAQDCSAIPPGLLEAEIFGYEAGAFTGASDSKPGLLLAAQGGTFYLDNVDSIPLEVQAKLLRALEKDAVRPLGGSSKRKLDVRFISSSQRDLKDLCARGEFRKDLYFRLSGICLVIPPLRERAQDVPLLLRHFCAQIRSGDLELSPPAMEALRSYGWPGNVRELESVVRRLALTSDGVVDEAQVARVLGLEGASPSFPRWIFEGRSYEQTLDDVKREYLLYLYERFEGDIDRIARELGLTKRNVYLRFSQAGIRPFEDRGPRAGA